MNNNYPNNYPPFSLKILGASSQGRVIVLQKLGQGLQASAVAGEGGHAHTHVKFSPAGVMQTHARHHAGEDGGKRHEGGERSQ